MAACGRDRYQAGFDVDAWTAQGRGRVAASAVRDSRQWFELLHTSRAYTAAMTAQTAAARTREKTPGAHTQQRNEITKRKSDTVVRGNKGVQVHGMWRREERDEPEAGQCRGAGGGATPCRGGAIGMPVVDGGAGGAAYWPAPDKYVAGVDADSASAGVCGRGRRFIVQYAAS